MVKENIFYSEEKKNGEGIGGKYRSEKEKTGREREENIGEGEYFVGREGK